MMIQKNHSESILIKITPNTKTNSKVIVVNKENYWFDAMLDKLHKKSTTSISSR